MHHILVHKNSNREVQTNPFSGKIIWLPTPANQNYPSDSFGTFKDPHRLVIVTFFNIYMYSIYLIEIYIIIKCHMHSI